MVLDTATRWSVNPATLLSRSRNTPFAGRTLTGRAALTLVGGAIVYQVEAPAGR